MCVCVRALQEGNMQHPETREVTGTQEPTYCCQLHAPAKPQGVLSAGREEPMGLSAKAEDKAGKASKTTTMTYSLPSRVSTRVRLSNTFILF